MNAPASSRPPASRNVTGGPFAERFARLEARKQLLLARGELQKLTIELRAAQMCQRSALLRTAQAVARQRRWWMPALAAAAGFYAARRTKGFSAFARWGLQLWPLLRQALRRQA